MATEEKLKPFKPFFKFLCVKSILFFAYWQSCLFHILRMFGLFDAWRAEQFYNLIICAEMVIAALAQSYAFSYEPYVTLNGNSTVLQSIGHVMTVNDVLEDAHSTFLSDIKVEFKNELALEETQMDLIIKHDQAFNWNEDDEVKLRISKQPKKSKGQKVINATKKIALKLRRKEKHHESDYDSDSTPRRSSREFKMTANHGGGAVPQPRDENDISIEIK